MITVTLDTNVLASGATASDSTIAHVIEAWFAGGFLVVLSPYILSELERVLMKPYFAERLSREAIADYTAAVLNYATVVSVAERVPRVAAHLEDDQVLATAAKGGADYLVTGDRDIQGLGRHQGVAIVSPRDFLRVLIE